MPLWTLRKGIKISLNINLGAASGGHFTTFATIKNGTLCGLGSSEKNRHRNGRGAYLSFPEGKGIVDFESKKKYHTLAYLLRVDPSNKLKNPSINRPHLSLKLNTTTLIHPNGGTATSASGAVLNQFRRYSSSSQRSPLLKPGRGRATAPQRLDNYKLFIIFYFIGIMLLISFFS
jgi:hypothetical protein